MNEFEEEFYATDATGGNRDPRDNLAQFQVTENERRLYLHGIPGSAEADALLVPRPQRPRSVAGMSLALGRIEADNPIVVRRGIIHSAAGENDEAAWESDIRPTNLQEDWVTPIRLYRGNNIRQVFGIQVSVTNFNDFFVNSRAVSRSLLELMRGELNTYANRDDNQETNAMIAGILGNRGPPPLARQHWFQIQLDWMCRSTNKWTFANPHADGAGGVVRATSGAFRRLTSVNDFDEGVQAMFNQLSEFYDFGADVPENYGQDARAVIQITRGRNGVPVGLQILNDPAIDDFRFLCNISVIMVRPGNLVEGREGGRSVRQRTVWRTRQGQILRSVAQPRVDPGAYDIGRGSAFGCYKPPVSEEEKKLHTFLTKKQSVLMIKNKDNGCFSRSLAVLLTKAYWTYARGEHSEFNEKRGSIRLSQTTMSALDEVFLLCGDATRLCRQIGDTYQQVASAQKMQTVVAEAISIYCGHDFTLPVDDESIQRFSDRLFLTIRIIDANTGFTKVAEFGEFESVCYVLKVGGHFHALRSMRGIMGKDYECLDCDVVFRNVDDHRSCPQRCYGCHARPCPGKMQYGDDKSKKRKKSIQCGDCNRFFQNQLCFDEHLKRTCRLWMTCGKPGCRKFKRKSYNDLSEHNCGDMKCQNCKQMVQLLNHRCFFQQKAPKDPVDKLLFFDFECAQETGTHIVTHVVARKENEREDLVFKPAMDGTFYNVLDDFCEFLFQGDFDGYTAIAHNGQGYDFQFILKWCLDHNMVPENVVRVGQKLKHMVINGVRFIDSLSFLLMPLSAFPKTFGFTEKVKGYFPHMFNTVENQLYIGVTPPKEMYVPEEMSVGAKVEFEKWYKEHAGDHFVFQDEILKYCSSDVDILQTGCLSFQHLFREITGVDPFAYITIAGACLAVYRYKFNDGKSIMTMTPDDAAFVRRGFFGGRTCVMQAHVKAKEDESIRYVDVTSLYPWVNTFCEYPLGNYERFEFKEPSVDDFEIDTLLDTVFGFLEVDLVCPNNLLLPVIPEKKDMGLKFDLLPKKKLVVSSVELKKAVSLGYKVTKLYGYIHWPETTFSLFKNYMMTFLKVKQESSGWSGKMLDGKQVETDAEKHAWIEKYFQEEGVRLDFDKVQSNPGIRAISKLCLNSLWGKMGQKPESRQVVYTSDHNAVLEYLDKYQVHDILDVGDSDMHEVVYSTDKAVKEPSFNTCVALAAMTTAHARMRLYSGLESVGDRAIYCDTDSIVYMSKQGLPDIEIGDKLGEWTDELGGDYIREFVATGPKSYAYVKKSGKSAIKCKGFKMSYLNCSSTLNFENYKNSLTGENFEMETITLHKIQRDKATKNVVTQQGAKKFFVPTLDRKGVVDSASETLRIYPFGYILDE